MVAGQPLPGFLAGRRIEAAQQGRRVHLAGGRGAVEQAIDLRPQRRRQPLRDGVVRVGHREYLAGEADPAERDDIVVFSALAGDHLKSIVDIQLARLARRLADRRLVLDVSDAARDWLASNGYDPVYGARPLRRLIQTAIGDHLAKGLLSGQVRDGDRVVVDLADDKRGLVVRAA